MAELADALDLGSSGRPCRFKSCYPHHRIGSVDQVDYLVGGFFLLRYCRNCSAGVLFLFIIYLMVLKFI